MLQQKDIVRFGVFTADLRVPELKKGRDTISLQNLPFRILKILLREPGKVVTREELRQQLWPADTFVDFERGISTAVSKLREALGDSASNPRFIETVGRRGYRFIAPVSTVAAETSVPVFGPQGVASAAAVAQSPAKEKPPAPVARIGLRRRALFFAVATVAIAIVVLAFDWISQPAQPRVVRMIRLSSSGRAEHSGGLHTDGSRVYFEEKGPTQWSLTQTSLAGGEFVPVPMPFPNAMLMAISPDHSEMLLTTRAEFGGKHALWIMPVQGGTPVRVADLEVGLATWFPDGKRLLCSSGQEVFSIDRDGGNRRHLFDVDGGAYRFAWKPDGTSFRFSVFHPTERITLWEASAAGTNVHPLLPGWNDPPSECCGVWSPDGKNYVFRSQQNGQEDLWLLREPSGWAWTGRPKPIRLTNGPTSFSEPLFSPDGKRIFALGLQPHGYVAEFDEKQQNYVPFPLPPGAFDLAFSHDGKWVAYIAPPALTLWRSRVDGSERLQLTTPPTSALRPRWSPDDKELLFVARAPSKFYTVHTVPADGGALHSVIENDAVYRSYGDWLPDGESVLISPEAGAQPGSGITVVNLKTHQTSELPGSKGLWLARMVPDGEHVVAISQDTKGIFLFDKRTQKWSQVGHTNQGYKFEMDKDSVYYQDVRDPGQAVFRVDIATGKSERFLDFSQLIRNGAMLCAFQGRAPDGSFVVSVSSSWADLYAFDLELPR